MIALTNVTMAHVVKEAFDYGVDAYLIKLSVSNDMLVKKVKEAISTFHIRSKPTIPVKPEEQ